MTAIRGSDEGVVGNVQRVYHSNELVRNFVAEFFGFLAMVDALNITNDTFLIRIVRMNADRTVYLSIVFCKAENVRKLAETGADRQYCFYTSIFGPRQDTFAV